MQTIEQVMHELATARAKELGAIPELLVRYTLVNGSEREVYVIHIGPVYKVEAFEGDTIACDWYFSDLESATDYADKLIKGLQL